MSTIDTTQPLLSAIEDRYFAEIGNAIRSAGRAACPSAHYLTFEWNTTEGEPYLDYRDFLDADHTPVRESDDEREARRDTFHSLGMGFESARDAREASDDVVEFVDADRDNSGLVESQYVFDLTHLRAVPTVSATVLAAALPVELLREAAALTLPDVDTQAESIRSTQLDALAYAAHELLTTRHDRDPEYRRGLIEAIASTANLHAVHGDDARHAADAAIASAARQDEPRYEWTASDAARLTEAIADLNQLDGVNEPYSQAQIGLWAHVTGLGYSRAERALRFAI